MTVKAGAEEPPKPLNDSIFFESIEMMKGGGLQYSPKPDAPELPSDMVEFKRELEETVLHLRLSLPANVVEDCVTGTLLRIAKFGLQGNSPQRTKQAKEDLYREKVVLATRGIAMRAEYLWRLAKPAAFLIVFGCVLIALGMFLNLNSNWMFEQWSIGLDILHRGSRAIGGLGFSFIGCAVGLYLSTLIKTRNITFASLNRIGNVYQHTPAMYALFLCALSIGLSIFLFFNVIQVGVAGNLLNDFVERPELGILIGLVCAFAEATVVSLLTKGAEPTGPHAT